jgi:hypothetical protein
LLLQGRILVPKARALLERIFDGKLTATPVETEDGPRFLVEGVASLSKMLALEGEVGQQKPTVKFASPGGFESGNSDPRKPSAHAILAEKSRESLRKAVAVTFRPIPRRSAARSGVSAT